MTRDEISSVLSKIGVLLEIKGENHFKTRAYENGARIIQLLDEEPEELVKEKKLSTIKGIGKALEQKITELVTTGRLEYYEDLKAQFPDTLFDLLHIPGLGPKRIGVLYNKLGIRTIGELEYACKENRLIDLPGFGEKTQQNILKSIAYAKVNSEKYLLHEAEQAAYSVVSSLKECHQIQVLSIAGSLRRRKEIIKDIDILVASDEPEIVMDYFVALPEVVDVTGKGETKASVRTKWGISIDLRVVTRMQYSYALHHFTGSKEHNTKMRHIAKSKGLKMNEYGLFSLNDDSLIPVSNEKELFKELGMSYIPPELREEMGEIDAAIENTLPKLVSIEDVQGIMHMHTRYSDGSNTITELAKEAKRQGYHYIGISDHSASAFYASGLKEVDIIGQHEEIDEYNNNHKDFYIFKGIESDILHDGSLDYNDDVLESFDFVIASVHSQFSMNKADMTERILKAIDNPYTTILGHPTGRLLLSRDGYEIDMDRILDKVNKRGAIIEINANPHRLDLDWRYVKKAKEMGIKLIISPDAHSIYDFYNTAYGISMARKGWCTKDDILNCLSAKQLSKVFKANKKG